ncbi:MAG: Stp1/IreP family PP2C-type Ser/Thr phosphatase [Candidatus Omnitrophota bacterium]
MKLYYNALSDVGTARTNNEDYLFAGQTGDDEYLFIVADGMGGHRAGEIASQKAVNVFVQQVKKGLGAHAHATDAYGIIASLKQTVLYVNEVLIKEGQESPEHRGMGTTLSVLYLKADQGYIAHVGDSRIYRFPHSNGTPTIEQLTEDHSFVGKLLRDGFITPEDARNHPRRNVLYQSIGIKSDITVQVIEPIPIETGRKFVLCSDGLYGVVSDEEITEHLKNDSPDQAVKQLVNLANAHGGPDNITVIIVSIDAGEEPHEDHHPTSDTVPDITAITQFDAPMVTAQEKRRRSKLICLILVGLLALLLALIIYISFNDANHAHESDMETEPQAYKTK